MKAIYNLCHHCAVAFPRTDGTCPECHVPAGRVICMNCGVSWLKTSYFPFHPTTCQEAPLPVGVWNPGFPGQQPYEPEKPLDGIPKYNWAEPQEILTVDDFDVCPSMAPRQDVFFTAEETAVPSARWSVMWRYKRTVFEKMIWEMNPDQFLIPSNDWRVHPISYNLTSEKKAEACSASLRLQFPGKMFACRRVQ